MWSMLHFGQEARSQTDYILGTYRSLLQDDPSHHCGGVTLFYKEFLRFVVESHQQHCPNVISFQMVMGRRRWHVVGFYLALRYASTLESMVTDICHRPRGAELLVGGNYNTEFESPNGNKPDEEITEVMPMEGLGDMT